MAGQMDQARRYNLKTEGRPVSEAAKVRPICGCCDPRLNVFTRRMNAEMSRRAVLVGAAASLSAAAMPARAQAPASKVVVSENVRIVDGVPDRLSAPSDERADGFGDDADSVNPRLLHPAPSH
jgi:hypothetical protein